jgi:hypothetical protein
VASQGRSQGSDPGGYSSIHRRSWLVVFFDFKPQEKRNVPRRNAKEWTPSVQYVYQCATSTNPNILPLRSRLIKKVPNCFRMSIAYAQIVRARSVPNRISFGEPAVKLGRQRFERNSGFRGHWTTSMKRSRSSTTVTANEAHNGHRGFLKAELARNKRC